MIAAVLALCAVNAALAGFIITLGVWMRADKRELSHARDAIDAQDNRADIFELDLRTERDAHQATQQRLDTERNLRAIAESQRNEAQRKTRELLRQHMRSATDDEIAELVRDVFASSLSIVPSSGVPETADGDEDRLLDPFLSPA